MSKYKVAYIDESEAELRKFQRFAHNHFDVVAMKPDADLALTVSKIIDNHVDAVVSDFDLTDQDSTIHYNGANLIGEILDERDQFPVFILTSFEDDAVSKGDDVNIVYEKSEINDGDKFLTRVKTQIEKYHHRIDENEKRLIFLIEKSGREGLIAHEQDELKTLDRFIEKALDKKSAMPDATREVVPAAQLSELLKKVDDLTDSLTGKP